MAIQAFRALIDVFVFVLTKTIAWRNDRNVEPDQCSDVVNNTRLVSTFLDYA